MNIFIKENTISTNLISDLNDYNEIEKNKNRFRIIQFNICGIATNFDEFICFLNQITNKFDIIVLSETHKIYDLQLFCIPEYKCIYNLGSFNKCDGLLILVKEEIPHSFVFKYIGQVKCVEINVTAKGQQFLLTCIYRSPAINENIFVDDFTDYLVSCQSIKNHIITGDINLDILRDDKNFVEDYKSILAVHGFTQCINKYTRPQSQTCLDHFFVKGENKQNFRTLHTFVMNYKITDHCPVILTFERNTKENSSKPQIIREKKYINYQQLKSDLRNTSWQNVYQERDLNLAWSFFLEFLQNLIKKNTRTIKQTNTRNGKKQWITKGLLNSIKFKNYLYSLCLKDPQNINLRNQYIICKNKLQKEINKAKRSFAEKIISRSNNQTSALWDCVNEICNKPNQKTIIDNIKLSNAQITSDKFEISNSFNEFFSEIGEKLAKKLKTPDDCNCENVEWSDKNLLFFSEIDQNIVINTIKKLKIKKAPGHDGIRSEILKEVAHELAPVLSYLINFGFRIGVFPDILKLGKIKPLFKEGDRTDLNNYRPISLISNFSKIIEMIIKTQLVKFLEINNLLSENQFGFRQGKSTEDAILYLTSKVYKALDDNKPCISVFVDLKKAFDTVCHRKLIKKMKQMGLRGSAINLIKSYLEGRSQFVDIDGIQSDIRTVACGVPQGTVLGPILFVAYINDLLKSNSAGSVISFADDTVIHYVDDSWEALKQKIETDFKKINEWFLINKLTLNQDKTKFLPFTSYLNNLPNFSQLEIDKDLKILGADTVKYLGIIIDSHFRWDKQIKNIISRTRYLVTRFAYLKAYLKLDNLKSVYHALVQSRFKYGIVGWGSARDCYLRNLDIIQKWILRVIHNKPRRYPSDKLFTESRVFDLRQLYFCSLMICINKNKIVLQPVAHSRQTRYRINCVVVPFTKKEIGHKSPHYLAAKFYNRLPEDLKALTYDRSFKRKVKSWIFGRDRQLIHNMYK